MRAFWTLLLLAFGSTSVEAWDYFGHHVVGAIAWAHLEPAKRDAVSRLLLQAPTDAGLASLLPPGPRAFEVRAREMFLLANGWADIVRDEAWPARKERYDRPEWHYVNRFWTETAAGPRRLEERGTSGELVDRLRTLERSVVDWKRAPAERAIDLAWILHLAGDVHQPLHSSARVTEREPAGDRGGNDFLLDDPEASTLHAYWDTILRRAHRQRHSESYFSWVCRVAEEISTRYPIHTFHDRLAKTDVEAWSKEGVAIAMDAAYPESLKREARPPRRYEGVVFERAAPQVALAGYRLAKLLDELF